MLLRKLNYNYRNYWNHTQWHYLLGDCFPLNKNKQTIGEWHSYYISIHRQQCQKNCHNHSIIKTFVQGYGEGFKRGKLHSVWFQHASEIAGKERWWLWLLTHPKEHTSTTQKRQKQPHVYGKRKPIKLALKCSGQCGACRWQRHVSPGVYYSQMTVTHTITTQSTKPRW